MLQCFSLPVHGNLAGHEHPDLRFISIFSCVHQLCVLFLDLFSMEIQIEYVAEMFQLLRIQPRRHRIKYVFDNLLYHKSLLSFTFHCKGWRLYLRHLSRTQTQLYSDTNAITANYKKGTTFLDNIDSLSSASQLTHSGFYAFLTITSKVNADAGEEIMSEYTSGDFYGVLIGKDISADNGCRFGTLIITSPRINSGIWICTIWEYKFIHWYKIKKQ